MQLDDANPWPGLESFEEDSHAFFFGRDREIQSLHKHVREAPVTVLYGQSGLGKTSLLRAGLFPLLREHGFLPIRVRLELKATAAPLTRQLHQSVCDAIHADVPDGGAVVLDRLLFVPVPPQSRALQSGVAPFDWPRVTRASPGWCWT